MQDSQPETGRVRGGGFEDGGPAGAGGPAQQDEPAFSGAGALGLGREQRLRVLAFPQRSGHPCLLLSGTSDLSMYT